MGTGQSKNKQTKDKQPKEKQTTRAAQLRTVEPVLSVHTPLVVSATDGAATKEETQPLQASDLEQSEQIASSQKEEPGAFGELVAGTNPKPEKGHDIPKQGVGTHDKYEIPAEPPQVCVGVPETNEGGLADKCQLSSVGETDPPSSPLLYMEGSLETSEGDNGKNSRSVFLLPQTLPRESLIVGISSFRQLKTKKIASGFPRFAPFW